MGMHEKTARRTPYPHIVKIEGVCGGEAIIDHDNQEEIDRVRQQNSYAYWQEHYADTVA